VQLVTTQLYEDVYAGKEVKRFFGTMKKNLFGETYISSHVMSRTVKPMMKYLMYT
jgi:hypothetical protein